jgi:hypothetical protein
MRNMLVRFVHELHNGNGRATIQIVDFHTEMCFFSIHRIWEKLVPLHKQMHNMNSNSLIGKVMYSMLFSKVYILMYTQRLVLHSHRCGGLCTMMVFNPNTLKSATTFTKR